MAHQVAEEVVQYFVNCIQDQSQVLANQLPNHTKFAFACESLKDYIFDCSDHHQANGYANSLKQISEYVGAKYKNGGDIRSSVLKETNFTVPLPTPPTIFDMDNQTIDEMAQMKLYEKRLDVVVRREGTLEDNIQ